MCFSLSHAAAKKAVGRQSSLAIWYYVHVSNLENRPVVAVIPHYNMPQTLVPLLKQVVAQQYDAVYVLDDCSTVCDVKDVVAPFGSTISLIAGSENRGAGANRNRILGANLGGAILHFIDADCELVSQEIPAAARKLLGDPQIGLVVGLVLNANGTQYADNYNPRLSALHGVSVRLHGWIATLAQRNPNKAQRLRRTFRRMLAGYPDTLATPQAQDMFAGSEANTLILYDTFAAIGGFDEKLRYLEAQDVGYKLQARHLKSRFDPSIVVRHHAVDVREKVRSFGQAASAYRIARKHGLPLR